MGELPLTSSCFYSSRKEKNDSMKKAVRLLGRPSRRESGGESKRDNKEKAQNDSAVLPSFEWWQPTLICDSPDSNEQSTNTPPFPQEGYSATLVGDTLYIFGCGEQSESVFFSLNTSLYSADGKQTCNR